jgi:GNAT superfamily N-acetyltransferase
MNVNVREARSDDAPALARLAKELGYPATADQMNSRLASACAAPAHGVFVAETDSVVGWIHVAEVLSLESGTFAEIQGLVVSEAHRGAGIGTLLVRHAEGWAAARGCSRMRVRTNVIRERTRAFYRKHGYATTKTQEVLDKAL